METFATVIIYACWFYSAVIGVSEILPERLLKKFTFFIFGKKHLESYDKD